MNVYIVLEGIGYGGSFVSKVFSTRAKAIEYASTQGHPSHTPGPDVETTRPIDDLMWVKESIFWTIQEEPVL